MVRESPCVFHLFLFSFLVGQLRKYQSSTNPASKWATYQQHINNTSGHPHFRWNFQLVHTLINIHLCPFFKTSIPLWIVSFMYSYAIFFNYIFAEQFKRKKKIEWSRKIRWPTAKEKCWSLMRIVRHKTRTCWLKFTQSSDNEICIANKWNAHANCFRIKHFRGPVLVGVWKGHSVNLF